MIPSPGRTRHCPNAPRNEASRPVDEHVNAVCAYTDASFDEVYINQAGPDQDGFFEFYAGQVLPRLRGA